MELEVPIVLNLEGGYHPSASAECVRHTLDALTGEQKHSHDQSIESRPLQERLTSEIDKSVAVQQDAIRI